MRDGKNDIKLNDPYHITNPPTERKQVVRARCNKVSDDLVRNNSENRRKLFDSLYESITGEKPLVHYYSQVVEFIKKIKENEKTK